MKSEHSEYCEHARRAHKKKTSSLPEAKSAIVTGSSRGIGSAIAATLGSLGYNLCLNCSSESSLETTTALAHDLEKLFSVKAIAVIADVSDPIQAQSLIDETLETWGTVDVLVNNAGITRDGLLARMKEEDFDRVIGINLKGTFNCCKAAIKPMMKQRHGRIINMSSVVGLYGNAGQTNYAASKAGIIGFTKSLAKEVASRSITVNAIAPGFIQTSMTDELSEAQKEAIRDRIGLKRFGTPEDVASLVGFLVGENASYITGQVIAIDGGLSL